MMQYDMQLCFQSLAEAHAQIWQDAQWDPSQALAGELCFLQTYFVKGLVASKAVASNHFRDMRPLLAAPLPEATHLARALLKMDPEDMAEDSCLSEGDGGDNDDEAPEATPADHYELAMAPERLTMDLPVQIAIFVYVYANFAHAAVQVWLAGLVRRPQMLGAAIHGHWWLFH